MTKPLNLRLLDLARTFENLATLARPTLDHIASELTHADGYPTRTPGAAPSTAPNRAAYDEDGNLLAPVSLTSVESAAETAWRLRADRAQLHDDVEACEAFAKSMRQVMRYAQGTRIATTDVNNGRCYTDPGLDGYLLNDEEGGWSDPGCTKKSRTKKPGMCDACRQRHERWREANQKKTLAEDRPIEHDSDVYTTDVGTAHARPISGAA